MSLFEAFRVACWTLVANPLRSFLTLLGIIIGISAIIAVVSVIEGLNLYVEENLSNLGPGVFVIQRFGIITNREDFLEAIRRNPELKLSDARALRELVTEAAAVAAEVHARSSIRANGERVEAVDIGGLNAEVLDIEPYDVAYGRIITRSEERRAAPVAFLGWEVSEKLFGNRDPVGKKVRVKGRQFEVIGVAAKRGSVFGVSRDAFAKIPITTFQKMFGSRGSVNISVKVGDKLRMQEIMDQCRVVLRARHHLDFHTGDDFGIVSSDGLNDLWKSLTAIIFKITIFVVGLSLVVGGIVIMNIMLVSVIERTSEIGIRKAVGARQRDIKRQFLIESIVLSSVGGVLGVSLAFAFAWLIKTFTPLPASFPLWAPILAVSVCGLIGVFFGLQPAGRAARLDPIEALQGGE